MGSTARYQKRLSGPLLDRIDIHIEVPRVEYDELSDPSASLGTSSGRQRLGEPSAAIPARVETAVMSSILAPQGATGFRPEWSTSKWHVSGIP